MQVRAVMPRRHLPRIDPFDLRAVALRPPPGVLPSDGRLLAQDQFLAAVADYGSPYGISGPISQGVVFPGYQVLAQWAQRPEFRAVVTKHAKEMTRRWVTLRSSSEGDNTDRLDELNDAMERYKVREHFREVAEHDGFFGVGQLYLDTGATDDPDELAMPLILSRAKIGRGGFKALRVVEATWTYPDGYNARDPLDPDFYRPTHFQVFQRKIHRSRLLRFIARPVPDMLKPAFNFGGLSLSQMGEPYVANWLRVRDNISDLVESFNTPVLKTNMAAVLSGEAADQVDMRAQLFNSFRSNRGVMTLDKEQEDFENISAPLSTLDALQAQAQEQMAAVWSTPLIVLLGITPSGLNASSDGEIRVFYDYMDSVRQALFSDHLNTVMKLVQLSLWGQVDPTISFTWDSLRELSELEQAQLRQANAQTDAAYTTAGIVDAEEVRTVLAGEEGGRYHGIDPEAVPEAAAPEESPPLGLSPPDDSDAPDDAEEAPRALLAA
jgi:phage-related protein (TIGR01555 family)